MTYEDEVIKSARDGLAWANVALTPEMEKLLRIIYQAGYKQGKLEELQKIVAKLDNV